MSAVLRHFEAATDSIFNSLKDGDNNTVKNHATIKEGPLNKAIQRAIDAYSILAVRIFENFEN